jgi:Secretion system C-terminal sorting domain
MAFVLQDITEDTVSVTLKQWDESKLLTMGVIVRTKVIKKPVKETRPIPVIGTEHNPSLKIWPNPAQPGQRITIENMNNPKGVYQLQISNMAGQIVYQQNDRWEKNDTSISLELPFIKPGEYIIQMINKKSGQNSAAKMIIQ